LKYFFANGASVKKLRKLIFVQIDTEAWPKNGLSPANKIITTLIVISIILVVIETEISIYEPYSSFFDSVDGLLAWVFVVEYISRLWVIVERDKYRGIIGRFRYAFTLTAIIDLAAVAPYFLGGGADFFLLRLLRLLRVFRLAKLGRFSEALEALWNGLVERKYELFVSFAIALFVLLCAAIGMYFFEKDVQPEAFGSIPRAMWWGIATLTTVGYGDVYPVTPPGKIFAGVIALAAIGLVAMPTGILAAAFSDAFQKNNSDK
jgi:voltage-gated potassium channel